MTFFYKASLYSHSFFFFFREWATSHVTREKLFFSYPPPCPFFFFLLLLNLSLIYRYTCVPHPEPSSLLPHQRPCHIKGNIHFIVRAEPNILSCLYDFLACMINTDYGHVYFRHDKQTFYLSSKITKQATFWTILMAILRKECEIIFHNSGSSTTNLMGLNECNENEQ